MVARVNRSAHQYGVTVFASGGDDHLLPKHNLAIECFNRWAKNGLQTVVLHIGDHDDKGVAIFETLADDVTQFVADYIGRDPVFNDDDPETCRAVAEHIVSFTRLAVTDEQIADPRYGLDGKDQGYDKSGRLKVQAEAIPFAMRAEMISTAIESLLDLDLLARARARAEADRAVVLGQLDRIISANAETTEADW
jgi:hypothetical protein